jgi:hypothetical protein
MLMEEIFREVYRNNIWGDPETVSGHGQLRLEINSRIS